MAGNTVNLEFAGDADKLAKAAKQSETALSDVDQAAKGTEEQFDNNSKSSSNLLDKYSKLGNAVSGAGDAIDQASGLLDTFSQIQNQSYEKSQAQQRALNDVQQSQADVNQAVLDGKQAQADYNQTLRDARQATLDVAQAGIDKEQADLDAANALKAYNEAVKKNGKNSSEAKQALIDLHQAQQDQKQAVEDGKQAQQDATQATIDGKQALLDGKQATIDAKGAQLDLNDAQREAHPPDVDKWSQQLQTYAPLLSGLVGITGLVTAAQWAWNAAQAASPTTWIILAVAALVAIIVVIATKTHWFQNIWNASWGAIKKAAGAVGSFFKDTVWGSWIKGSFDAINTKIGQAVGWFKGIPGRLKSALSSVGSFVSAPFRAGFNLVATAWNNTIGRLHWTVPGWVPVIGGNSIGAPSLPHFHEGGTVPGIPGAPVMALLQGGETVTPVSGSGGTVIEIRSGGSQLDDLLVEVLSRAVRLRGGNVQLVLGGRNA